nr:hypothetical protein [Tanacetum cinerariifolium]
EPEKPLKKKDQISLDEEVARKLEAKIKAEMDEEERIAKEKIEANIVIIAEWDNTQAIIDADSPGVIVYEYDGLPMQPVAPPSLDYVPGPEHQPSPDYVPGPEHPPSYVKIPYIPEPEYP